MTYSIVLFFLLVIAILLLVIIFHNLMYEKMDSKSLNDFLPTDEINNSEKAEGLLYLIGMESDIAHRNMKFLCKFLQINYPPRPFSVDVRV
jgi:hypothetical protein